MEDNESGYKLLLEFDSDDPEFGRGFEAGRLWERIKSDQTTWDEIIHVSNAEMVMRMCESQERKFRSEDINNEYIQIWIE